MPGEILGEIWAVAGPGGTYPVDVRVFARGITAVRIAIGQTPVRIITAGVPLSSLTIQNLGGVAIEIGNDQGLTYGTGMRIAANSILSNGAITPGGPGAAVVESYAKASLPSVGNAGRLARLTDYDLALWEDLGTKWVSLSHEIFDAKFFCAKGDGVTDDTAAIQAAIDAAAAAGGGVVLLPRGTYVLSKAAAGAWCLNLKTSVILRGAGPSATTLFMANGQAAFTRPISTQSGVTDIGVLDLKIDGNRVNQPLDSATQQDHSIFLYNVTRAIVADCEIDSNSGDGIMLYGDGAASYCSRVIIQRNRFTNGQRVGVSLISCAEVHVVDNHFTQSLANADAIHGEPDVNTMPTRDVLIARNVVETHGSISVTGFEIDSEVYRRVHIVDNIIKSAGAGAGSAINIFGIPEVTISGNTVKDSAAFGIFYRGLGYSKIVGNTVINPGSGSIGIAVQRTNGGAPQSPIAMLVSDNIIRDGGHGGVAALQIADCTLSKVSDNVLTGVQDFGIRMPGGACLDCEISDNLVSYTAPNAGSIGVWEQAAVGNDRNTICDNVVIGSIHATPVLVTAANSKSYGNTYGQTSSGFSLQQSGSLFAGAGVPAVGLGNNGDIYFNTAGGAGTTIYQKRVGVWVATAA